MTHCTGVMLHVYRAYVARTSVRISFIEKRLASPDAIAPLNVDEIRNVPDVYLELFSDSCRSFVETLYGEALRELRDLEFEDSDEVLRALNFIQEVTATALWRYNRNVGSTLEAFAREFDRLDLLSERQRLHARTRVVC